MAQKVFFKLYIHFWGEGVDTDFHMPIEGKSFFGSVKRLYYSPLEKLLKWKCSLVFVTTELFLLVHETLLK